MWKGDREMKKLFISQPMNGRTDEEILKERKEVIKKAESMIGEPVEVIDSFFETVQRMLRLCGIWQNHWNCCPRQMWHILQRVGRRPEGAR